MLISSDLDQLVWTSGMREVVATKDNAVVETYKWLNPDTEMFLDQCWINIKKVPKNPDSELEFLAFKITHKELAQTLIPSTESPYTLEPTKIPVTSYKTGYSINLDDIHGLNHTPEFQPDLIQLAPM